MKAKMYDGIVTTVDIIGDFTKKLFPKGTSGTIVECYEEPQEGYAVDLALPDESEAGGFTYDNVILYPEQFVLERPYQQERQENSE